LPAAGYRSDPESRAPARTPNARRGNLNHHPPDPTYVEADDPQQFGSVLCRLRSSHRAYRVVERPRRVRSGVRMTSAPAPSGISSAAATADSRFAGWTRHSRPITRGRALHFPRRGKLASGSSYERNRSNRWPRCLQSSGKRSGQSRSARRLRAVSLSGTPQPSARANREFWFVARPALRPRLPLRELAESKRHCRPGGRRRFSRPVVRDGDSLGRGCRLPATTPACCRRARAASVEERHER
jgi:hypothetical protein